MMSSKEDLLKEMSRCVLEMEDDETSRVAQEYADAGHDPKDGILLGLVDGMNKASDLYDAEEYFIPEMLICSQAMYNGLDVLRPLMPKDASSVSGRAVIGVVEGDTHDIGKNLVKIMLESAGYEVVDLGRDVPVQKFVDTVREIGASVLALSTLMSTSMKNMKRVIDLLAEAGIRDKVFVIVGGGPISQAFAKKIGADGYSDTATEAVRLVDGLISREVLSLAAR